MGDNGDVANVVTRLQSHACHCRRVFDLPGTRSIRGSARPRPRGADDGRT
ncbi:hypothetical protein HMPREF0321_2227 [Dermacoccus sp. Ellin185]|nr:hypothetical protein HMPREF0321_2227 [Dermacoccus sp. Ellin185]